MHFQDQLDNTIEIKEVPKRIICLVPSLTELLVDLDIENHIVGVTKFCVHPKDLRSKKTIVGGTKNIKLNRIRALQPDFILCNKEENTKQIVDHCTSIAPTFVTDIYTVDDTIEVIRSLGKIFNRAKIASDIISNIQNQVNSFRNFIKDRKTVNVSYFIWKKPWMVAAKGTFIHYLLEENGFKNVFEHLKRYPKITIEELSKMKHLDYVLLSSEPYPFNERDIIELQNMIKSKILLVDGEYFSWYGSRLIEAFDYFKRLRAEINV